MNLNNPYTSPADVALSNFVKALALPVRIGIVRFILENGNAVKREQLSAIPYNRLTVNQHINELKHLDIIKTQVRNKETVYSINDTVFIKMSGHFLALFEPIRHLNEQADTLLSKPRIKKKPTRKAASQSTTFGAYLREKRKAAGFSQAELSERLKMDRAWISKVETDKHAVRAEKLALFAEALDIPLSDLKQVYYQSKIDSLTKEGLELK